MRRRGWIIILAVLGAAACAGGPADIVEPTTDFSLNFCNFPTAWTVSRGRGVEIGVVIPEGESGGRLLERLRSAAPEAEVKRIDPDEFYGGEAVETGCRVCLLAAAPAESALEALRDRIREMEGRKGLLVIPAGFGPMTGPSPAEPWAILLREAGPGALIVGVHGRFYQLGALSFWESVPVDLFVLYTRMNDDQAREVDFLIPEPLETPAYLAAAAAALLISRRPELSSAGLKRELARKGRSVTWLLSDLRWGREERLRLEPYLGDRMRRLREEELRKHGYAVLRTYTGTCLDAAMALGLNPPLDGEWCRSVLRAEEAGKRSTGEGVVVAILDHMFEADDWSLAGRTVEAGSVLEGAPVFDPETSLGHGTWMARDLVKIAPGVRIMPVRFCGRGRYGDPDLYIRGIDYAVDHGADIISISHQPLPEDRRADLDAAVERAARRGAILVYIHYQGTREDVVVPRPIEFAWGDPGEDKMIFLVGTNFIDEDSFPATWGLSPTAPIVSGVIAMMKQLRPELTPLETARILRRSSRPLPSGGRVLDAVLALDNCR